MDEVIEHSFNVRKIVNEYRKIRITVKGRKRFRLRTVLGCQLFKFAAWVTGLESEIELKEK